VDHAVLISQNNMRVAFPLIRIVKCQRQKIFFDKTTQINFLKVISFVFVDFCFEITTFFYRAVVSNCFYSRFFTLTDTLTFTGPNICIINARNSFGDITRKNASATITFNEFNLIKRDGKLCKKTAAKTVNFC
jgi:hypothetical protein